MEPFPLSLVTPSSSSSNDTNNDSDEEHYGSPGFLQRAKIMEMYTYPDVKRRLPRVTLHLEYQTVFHQLSEEQARQKDYTGSADHNIPIGEVIPAEDIKSLVIDVLKDTGKEPDIDWIDLIGVDAPPRILLAHLQTKKSHYSLKISRPTVATFSTLSEIATMAFAREAMGIPTPKVIAHSSTEFNPLKHEWILYECATQPENPREPENGGNRSPSSAQDDSGAEKPRHRLLRLADVWSRLTINKRDRIVKDIAQLHSRLLGERFIFNGIRNIFFRNGILERRDVIDVPGSRSSGTRTVMRAWDRSAMTTHTKIPEMPAGGKLSMMFMRKPKQMMGDGWRWDADGLPPVANRLCVSIPRMGLSLVLQSNLNDNEFWPPVKNTQFKTSLEYLYRMARFIRYKAPITSWEPHIDVFRGEEDISIPGPGSFEDISMSDIPGALSEYFTVETIVVPEHLEAAEKIANETINELRRIKNPSDNRRRVRVLVASAIRRIVDLHEGGTEFLASAAVIELGEFQVDGFRHESNKEWHRLIAPKFSYFSNTRVKQKYRMGCCLELSNPVLWDKEVNRGPYYLTPQWLLARLTAVHRKYSREIKRVRTVEDAMRCQRGLRSAECLGIIVRLIFYRREVDTLDNGPGPAYMFSEEETFLWNDAMTFTNILVTPEGEFAGIADWGSATVVPRWRACVFPSFLGSPMRDPLAIELEERNKYKDLYLRHMELLMPGFTRRMGAHARLVDIDLAINLLMDERMLGGLHTWLSSFWIRRPYKLAEYLGLL